LGCFLLCVYNHYSSVLIDTPWSDAEKSEQKLNYWESISKLRYHSSKPTFNEVQNLGFDDGYLCPSVDIRQAAICMANLTSSLPNEPKMVSANLLQNTNLPNPRSLRNLRSRCSSRLRILRFCPSAPQTALSSYPYRTTNALLALIHFYCVLRSQNQHFKEHFRSVLFAGSSLWQQVLE
jgi:hypothetical protein